MQLKIKRYLKDGIHHVSLDSIGFTPQEKKKTKKFGMPLLNLSAEGLGVHRLDRIHMTIRTETVKEAEEVELILMQKIRDELGRLLAQKEISLRERMGRFI